MGVHNRTVEQRNARAEALEALGFSIRHEDYAELPALNIVFNFSAVDVTDTNAVILKVALSCEKFYMEEGRDSLRIQLKHLLDIVG